MVLFEYLLQYLLVRENPCRQHRATLGRPSVVVAHQVKIIQRCYMRLVHCHAIVARDDSRPGWVMIMLNALVAFPEMVVDQVLNFGGSVRKVVMLGQPVTGGTALMCNVRRLQISFLGSVNMYQSKCEQGRHVILEVRSMLVQVINSN